MLNMLLPRKGEKHKLVYAPKKQNIRQLHNKLNLSYFITQISYNIVYKI